MPPTETFSTTITSVEYRWPVDVTPLERIMLAAHGDLQRILSAFFARPITITPVLVKTIPPPDTSALTPTPSSPTRQKRQVHLVCAGRTVCIATSSVSITSTTCAQLFLKEGYAIGQIFRKLGVVPDFELLDVGLVNGNSGSETRKREKEASDVYGRTEMGEKQIPALVMDREKRKLWRRYTLSTDGFAAEIVEVFPDRDMFVQGERWLSDPQFLSVISEESECPSPTETLVHLDEGYDTGMLPSYAEPVKDVVLQESSGGLIRCMAVFIAVLLLLNVQRQRDSDDSGPAFGEALFSRISRLLDTTRSG